MKIISGMNGRAWLTLSVMIGIMLLVALGVSWAEAADTSIGSVELTLVEKIFTGNIGLALGLAIVAAGLWKFANGDTQGAIVLGVLGVLLTLLPGVYNGLRMIVCPIVGTLGGKCSD